MKGVYILLNSSGSIGYNMFTSKGTAYADKEKAEKALQSKRLWKI